MQVLVEQCAHGKVWASRLRVQFYPILRRSRYAVRSATRRERESGHEPWTGSSFHHLSYHHPVSFVPLALIQLCSGCLSLVDNDSIDEGERKSLLINTEIYLSTRSLTPYLIRLSNWVHSSSVALTHGHGINGRAISWPFPPHKSLLLLLWDCSYSQWRSHRGHNLHGKK